MRCPQVPIRLFGRAWAFAGFVFAMSPTAAELQAVDQKPGPAQAMRTDRKANRYCQGQWPAAVRCRDSIGERRAISSVRLSTHGHARDGETFALGDFRSRTRLWNGTTGLEVHQFGDQPLDSGEGLYIKSLAFLLRGQNNGNHKPRRHDARLGREVA